jgi:membrane-associated phospholipid phosphatase
MSQGSTRADASRALLQGGLLFLLGFLVLTVVVTQQHFVGADLAARSLIHQSHHPVLMGFMEGASFLGGQPGQVAVVVVGVMMLWPRRRRWALALPVVVAGAGAVQFMVKWAVDRPRPNLDSWGFPSAHVLSLVVLCGYLAYVATIGSARRGRRRLAVGACVGIVGTVAYSRMYLDAHFLSDVLGGFTAGLAYLFVAIWATRSAPRLGRARRATPLATGAEGLLVPAPAGSAAEPLVATVAVAVMTPATPALEAS